MSLSATPLTPATILPDTTGNLFEVLAGATNKEVMPCGVIATLGADSFYLLRFDVGPLPAGTPKLLIKSRTSDIGAHAWKVDVAWNVATSATDVDSMTLNAVTANTTTINNDTAHAWAETDTKIVLDGTSVMAADRSVYVKITLRATGWTVNAAIGFTVELIWE